VVFPWHNNHVSLVIKCSEFNADNYQNKKLLWFNREYGGHFELFPSISSDRKTFVLNATGFHSDSSISKAAESQTAVVTKQIDEETLRKMDKPKSRSLKAICDYVIFDDSPQAESKFGAE
jgi:hypothetical protein